MMIRHLTAFHLRDGASKRKNLLNEKDFHEAYLTTNLEEVTASVDVSHVGVVEKRRRRTEEEETRRRSGRVGREWSLRAVNPSFCSVSHFLSFFFVSCRQESSLPAFRICTAICDFHLHLVHPRIATR